MSNVTKLEHARIARHLAPAGKPPTAAHILSFMAPPDTEADPDNLRTDYWAVSSSGNFVSDIEAGRSYADEYLAFVGMCPTIGSATLLTDIIGAMVDKAQAGDRWTGVHIAFLNRISRYVTAAAALQEAVRDE